MLGILGIIDINREEQDDCHTLFNAIYMGGPDDPTLLQATDMGGPDDTMLLATDMSGPGDPLDMAGAGDPLILDAI